MVDNENQWEEAEYSENGTDGYEDGYQNEQYSDEGYDEQGYDYEEYDEEDDDYVPQKKSGNPLLVLLILFILLGVGGYIAYSKFFAGNAAQNSAISQQNNSFEMQSEQPNMQPTNENLADSFFEEAGGNSSDMMSVDFNSNGETNVVTGEGADASVATVTETPQSEGVSQNDLFESPENSQAQNHEEMAPPPQEDENNSIMVVYNKATRLNPFKPPYVDKAQSTDYGDLNTTDFEIIEPPVQSVPDESLTRLLQTQISGILYDEESPSAIVNINGLDNFVKAGDVVSGYRIDSITKDKVQVSYKDNSYVASVGELFTRGNLDKQRAVVNLEEKFAGRYKNKN